MTALLELHELSKEYSGVRAVSDVSLDFHVGEIVGLVGKNGAGKSTVIKMLAGAVTPDAGRIVIGGEPVEIPNPQSATEFGMAFMHQELEQIPHLTVAENVLLGSPFPRRTRTGLLDWRGVFSAAEDAMSPLRAEVDVRQRMDQLSPVHKRLVMIARAVHRGARFLVLDEPTTSLTEDEIRHLHHVLRKLRAGGTSIVYVSHRLDEILGLTDRIVVMRDGRVTETRPTVEFGHDALVTAITGRADSSLPDRSRNRRDGQQRSSDTVMSVTGLVGGGSAPATFRLGRGEVVGIAGLVGSGRTELLRLIFGADRAAGGHVEIGGRSLTPRTPRDGRRLGMALLPEDRRHEGLHLDFPVRGNLVMNILERMRSRFPLLLSRRRESAVANDWIQRLSIATSGPEQPVRQLSGGNQQKVVIGKWLACNPEVLLFDEPTIGVDVSGKAQIYRIIEDLADQGRGILLVSSEFGELVAVCDRVLVIRNGEIVEELAGMDINEQRIVAGCFGSGTPAFEEE